MSTNLNPSKSYHGPVNFTQFGRGGPGKTGIQLTQYHGQPDYGFIQLSEKDAIAIGFRLVRWGKKALRERRAAVKTPAF